MVDFTEQNLRFSFDSTWQVIKYDDDDCYRKGIGILTDTKAVDFICLQKGTLFLIEVKDFREFRIENQKRLTSGELAIEVAQKVRDSIAGMVGFYRQPGKAVDWKHYIDILTQPKGQVKVVIWLEYDLPKSYKQREKVRKSVEGNLFKQKLKWLSCNVLVCNQDDPILASIGLNVSDQ